MFEMQGRYNTATVYASTVDGETYAQVLQMCNTEELRGCKIRMMPDMHASEGCTVGTSIALGKYANPAYVGGDIGCGMQVYRLKNTEIDFEKLDRLIRTEIPSGAVIHERTNPAIKKVPLEELHCYANIRHKTVKASLGTLGGGNHFIEIDRSENGELYLVIHSGSRRLGRDVAGYHQLSALYQTFGVDEGELAKKPSRRVHVQTSKKAFECFLSGEPLARYLHDMNIAVRYASVNRQWMGERIIAGLELDVAEAFETIHNYIDTADRVLRKGAVSAKEGEKLLIPINMKDGSLICIGKGNPDWNHTAPHGAGRVMSRSDAKEAITLDEYRECMKGIFSTSVSEATIDESPMAYRRIDEILDTIEPTATVKEILTPVYNFKASKYAPDDETEDGAD